MESNFKKVIDFNEKFGIKVYDKVQLNIFDENPKLLDYRMNLIREEVRELEDAVKNKDFKETIDALSDILYVVYGMGASIGIDLDKSFDIVHKSNMTKLCRSEEEAKKTVEYYEVNKEKLGYDSPDYRLSDDGKYYVVYNRSTMKILKSIYYEPADFKEMLK